MSIRGKGSTWVLVGAMTLSGGCVVDDGGDDGAGTGAVDESGTNGGDGSGADGVDESTGGPAAPEVPDSAYCDPVSDWAEQDSAFEQEVLELVNDARAEARTCGADSFGAAPPLSMEPRLRCAARVHSLDMAVRAFFDHTNPDGESPFDRIEQAGYEYRAAGENIAAGQTTPAEVVAGWLDSPGHCSNIMSPDYIHLGVGYVFTDSGAYPHYWTQAFGSPL